MIASLSWKGGGRQECFFTAVDPKNTPILTQRFTENEARMIPNTMTWRSVQNTVCLFDLKIAQDTGVDFYP